MDKIFPFEEPVTYLNLLNTLSISNIHDNISIKINDEYFEISKICMAKEESNDILDEGHIYLEVKL